MTSWLIGLSLATSRLSGRRGRLRKQGLGAGLRKGKAQTERERRALAFFAARPYRAPHQFNQASGNGQTEPAAAESSRNGIVGLAERLKQAVQLVAWNADPGV